MGRPRRAQKYCILRGFRAPPCCLGLAGAIFSRNFTCQLRFSHTSSLDAFLGHAKNVVTGFPGVSKNRISHEDGAKKCKNIRSKRLQIQPLKMIFWHHPCAKRTFWIPPERLQKGSLGDAAGLGGDLHVNLRIKLDFGPPETQFYT